MVRRPFALGSVWFSAAPAAPSPASLRNVRRGTLRSGVVVALTGLSPYLCVVLRRTAITTVATARCIATSDTFVPTDAVADSGPARDTSAKTIAMTVQTAWGLAVN